MFWTAPSSPPGVFKVTTIKRACCASAKFSASLTMFVVAAVISPFTLTVNTVLGSFGALPRLLFNPMMIKTAKTMANLCNNAKTSGIVIVVEGDKVIGLLRFKTCWGGLETKGY